MMISETTILAEIDLVLQAWDAARAKSKYDDLSDLKGGVVPELVTTLSSAIERFAPPSSTYAR